MHTHMHKNKLGEEQGQMKTQMHDILDCRKSFTVLDKSDCRYLYSEGDNLLF